MKNAVLRGKSYAGNLHVRFDEGEGASYLPIVSRLERGAKPRRWALVAVTSLDTVGNRRERLSAKAEGGRLCFTAGIRPPEARLYYEVVRNNVK